MIWAAVIIGVLIVVAFIVERFLRSDSPSAAARRRDRVDRKLKNRRDRD